VVRSDICGPMQVSTITGEKYFITFMYEKSGRIAVTLPQRKDQALQAFQAYQAWAEQEARRRIEALRIDGGGEYASHNFQRYLKSAGIVHCVSPPYTSSQNGFAERANRTLMEGAHCMIADSKHNNEFWGYAVATAAHIHNRLPSRSHEDRSLLQHWTGTVPSIGHLRVFRSVTYTLVPPQKRSKLDRRSTKCILVGYDENSGSKVSHVYNPTLQRIVSSRDVIIDEKGWIAENQNTSSALDEIEITLPDVSKHDEMEVNEARPLEHITPPASGSADSDPEGFCGETIVVRPPNLGAQPREQEVSIPAPRRSQRQPKRGQKFNWGLVQAMLASMEEHQTLKAALESEDSAHW